MQTILKKLRWGALAGGLVAAASVAGISIGPGAEPVMAAVGLCADGSNVSDSAGGLGAGGEFHALTPVRIYDTRNPALDSAPAGPKPGRKADQAIEFEVPVVGQNGLPAFTDSDGDGKDDVVLAVAVNVTVAEPTSPGYLQAYGKGASPGVSSIVNFYAGETVPNTAILGPGADGKLTMRLVQPVADGTGDVIVDLFGWFSSCGVDERGARIVPVTPGRIYDSREAVDGGKPIGAAGQIEIPIRGVDTRSPNAADVVPNSEEVVGALVNITGVNVLPASAATYVSATPAPTPAGQTPATSNLNLNPGQVRSVMAMVPVGSDGKIRLYNLAGSVDLAVDIVAYMANGADVSTRQGRVVPLVAPFRAFDTREAAHQARTLGPAQAEAWNFAKTAKSALIGDQSVGPQLGVLGNLTSTELERQYPEKVTASYMASYPSSVVKPPEVSNITITEGQTMPNLALLQYGSNPELRDAQGNQICSEPYCVTFFNRAGYIDYLYDISALILAD